MADVTDHSPRHQVHAVATAVLITVSSAFPFFLTGALGPEIRGNLNMSESMFGVVSASFFLGAALGSIILGRVGEHIGPRRLTLRTLSVTIGAGLAIALFVRSGPQLGVLLFAAGVANAGSQTAANRILGDIIHDQRLGTAIAVKQSGMPAASMVGGLAVPVIALQFGWRWSYALGVMMASFALAGVIANVPPVDVASDTPRPKRVPNTAHRTLVIAAIGAGFASIGAGATTTWLTSSAVDAGWTPGNAGLLLSVCAAVGISLRLTLGVMSDRQPKRLPLRGCGVVLVIGAVGAVILGIGSHSSQALGGLLANGIGWTWPALFNIGVVRANPSAPGAATGVTQTGVYVGVLTSPMLVAALVEVTSFTVAWTVTAASMVVGAVVMASLAPVFVPPKTTVAASTR